MSAPTPNGFAGEWNPICPSCGGYMHTGHTDECPVTLARKARNERLVELLRLSAPESPISCVRPNHKVAALYVKRDGSYAGLPDVEMWDEERDARLYDGPWPVVAHPPCNTWCMLASVNEARWGKMIGDDGGCFEAALASVRRWGGVLEHPAYTLAWARFGLPRPVQGVWLRDLWDQGWVAQVSQSAYGHPARKRTWLYFVGADPLELDWRDLEGIGVVGAGVHSGQSAGRPRVDGYEASRTPEAFRDVLLAMARSCHEVQSEAVA